MRAISLTEAIHEVVIKTHCKFTSSSCPIIFPCTHVSGKSVEKDWLPKLLFTVFSMR